VLGVETGMPLPGIVAMALIAVETFSVARSGREPHRNKVIIWFCTLVALFCVAFGIVKDHRSIGSYWALSWLTALALTLAGSRVTEVSSKRQWKALAMLWAISGGGLWLAFSYARNLSALFHFGLLINLTLLLLCRRWFRVPALGIQVINTLMLLLVGIPIVDLMVRLTSRPEAQLQIAERICSYEDAKRDPQAFYHWWKYYLSQMNQMGEKIIERNSTGLLPHRLRPNSQCMLGQSFVSINSLGLRGKELPKEKGNTYRIVALGESTTFGITLKQEDKPWPELLEVMIRERLRPRRPVDVINCGTPAFNLEDNLHRLQEEILPLKPDMIISYHGINGFPLLYKVLSTSPPAYKERPLKLLANGEYKLRLILYRQRHKSEFSHDSYSFQNLMRTDYARAYHQLIHAATTNGIRLVLGNFSMAVNGQSDPDIVEFYRPLFPLVYEQIKANTAHSLLVEQMAQKYPGLVLVDTHPLLDGYHEKFIDLMHFTQAGREQLAESMFAGIKEILSEELSEHPAGSE
jgi:lysophospholipase L1-like esterase